MSVYYADDIQHFQIALNSIMTQSRLPEQIVVVVDGEVSHSVLKVLKASKKSSVEKGIQFDILELKTNSGLGVALAKGAEICTGKFIVRMDADDISRENRLKLAEDYLCAHPKIDVLGGQILEFTDGVINWSGARIVPIGHQEVLLRSKLFNPMNHVTVVIRRSTLEGCGGYRHCPFFEDYYLWVRLLASGVKFSNLPDITVDVRVSSLAERRRGFSYIRHEINFAKKCYTDGFWNPYQALKFSILRTPFRLLPISIISRIYKYMRTNRKKV